MTTADDTKSLTKLHDVELESFLIGCILKDKKALEVVSGALKPDHFLARRLQFIYIYILKEYSRTNSLVDIEQLYQKIKNEKSLKEIDREFLYGLVNNVTTTAGINYHIQKLKDTALRFKLDDLAEKIKRNVVSPAIPSDENILTIIEFLNNLESVPQKEKPLAELVKDFIVNSSGIFYSDDIYKQYSLFNRKEKQAVCSALRRMVSDGLIKKDGKRNGCFRKIESEFREDDWKTADTQPFDLRMPFGIERYVEIAPNDLILIAGVTNSGKSSLCFEFTRLNMRRHPVYYFSSEINARGFRKRIQKSDLPLSEWQVHFSDDWANPVDIIQPNAINIVDYIEPPEGEFYKIPTILTDIHRKLKGGIAICCLQKNKDKEYGVGGQQVLNKASLALNLDPDYPGAKVTMVKVKDYRDEINPSGFVQKFKIVNGIKLLPAGIWEPP